MKIPFPRANSARRSHFEEFENIMQEYFDLEHVPPEDLNKPVQDVFYMPMHAVRKEASTTTKRS